MDWKSGYGYGYGRVQYKDIISSRMISDKNSTLNASSYPCSLISPNNLNCRMWNPLQPLAIKRVEDPDHARVHLVQDQPLVLLPVLHTQYHPTLFVRPIRNTCQSSWVRVEGFIKPRGSFST